MKKKIELIELLFCVSSAIQTALSIKVNNRIKELNKTVNSQSLRIDDLTKMAELSAVQCSSEDGLIDAKIAELYALDDIDKSYNMKIDKIECPLGSKCEYINDDKEAVRCAWYTKLVGKDPQSTKEIDEWGCAMSWLPVMLVENAQMQRGVRQATESFRNEMTKGQDTFNKIFAVAVDKQIKLDASDNAVLIEDNKDG